MKRLPNDSSHRGGFTLIELLVVIAIIAVLASLITGAAQRVRLTAVTTQAQVEVNELAAAITAFKVKYKVPYVPSKIRLREDLVYNTNANAAALEQNSLNWIQQWWPNITAPVNWSGRNWKSEGTNHHQVFDLEGDQALVFFLSGIPGPIGAGQGFSTNPKNPAAHINDDGSVNTLVAVDAKFYDFTSARLLNRGGLTANSKDATGGLESPVPAASWRFFSYADPFTVPNRIQIYAYYSAYKRAGDYKHVSNNDCIGIATFSGIGPNFRPDAAGQPLNPSSFQIISAGSKANYSSGPFGPGGS
jgi:prepilin-type N-terminal cleavage/methylation domain-containing protein